MSKLDTLDLWLDEFREDHGCVGSWLEYDYFIPVIINALPINQMKYVMQ